MSQYVSPILTAPDHAVIESLLYCEGGHAGPRSFALRRKLADAVIVQPDNVAPHIMTLHSRVRFRIDGGPPELMRKAVGWLGSDDFLMFATDYPHGYDDDLPGLLSLLSENGRGNMMAETARQWYRL